MPSYTVATSTINTASATNPLGQLFCILRSQPAIYEINMGSDASADNAVTYALQRTALLGRGTSAATFTPVDTSPNALTANSTYDTGWSGVAVPTLTASAFVLQWAQHQRGTYRWVAYDYTKLLTCATSAGLSLMSRVVSATFNASYSISFQE